MLFFDRKAGSDTPWTKDLWIYDLRTNQHFTRRTNPLARPDLDDFVEDLQVALAEFAELAESLQGIGVEIEAEVEL